jgi:hypothetical protein
MVEQVVERHPYRIWARTVGCCREDSGFVLQHGSEMIPKVVLIWLVATANAVIFQASVGLLACLANQRHRAVVPISVAHALAIA